MHLIPINSVHREVCTCFQRIDGLPARPNGFDCLRNLWYIYASFQFCMRKTALSSLFILFYVIGYGQKTPIQFNYGKLDTVKTTMCDLMFQIGANDSDFYVDNNKVDYKTYSYYDSLWNNEQLCTPCFLRTYDINDTLVRQCIQYQDCRVGHFEEYYSGGGRKIIGQYKDNPTPGRWQEFMGRGGCVKEGIWYYYDEDG